MNIDRSAKSSRPLLGYRGSRKPDFRAHYRSFPFWLRDRTETSKGRQTVSRRPGVAERAGQRGASAENFLGGALVRARDFRSSFIADAITAP